MMVRMVRIAGSPAGFRGSGSADRGRAPSTEVDERRSRRPEHLLAMGNASVMVVSRAGWNRDLAAGASGLGEDTAAVQYC